MSISSAPSFNLSTFSYGGANYTITLKVIGARGFPCLKFINSIESRLKLTSLVSVTHRLTFTNRDFSVHCVRPDSTGNTISGSLEGEKGNFDDESRVVEIGSGDRQIDNFGDGGGGDDGGGGSFGGGDGGESDSEDEREFGPILKFEDVMKEVEARGVELPPDMMEAAKRNGIRKLFLLRYLDFQVG